MPEEFEKKKRFAEELGNFVAGATIGVVGACIKLVDDISELIGSSIAIISVGTTYGLLLRYQLVNGRMDSFGVGIFYTGFLVSTYINQFIKGV